MAYGCVLLKVAPKVAPNFSGCPQFSVFFRLFRLLCLWPTCCTIAPPFYGLQKLKSALFYGLQKFGVGGPFYGLKKIPVFVALPDCWFPNGGGCEQACAHRWMRPPMVEVSLPPLGK